MKNKIDTFVKIFIASMSISIVWELLDNVRDILRWSYGIEYFIVAVIAILIIYPMVEALDKAIKLSTSGDISYKVDLWKKLIIVQAINIIWIYIEQLIIGNSNTETALVLNIIVIVYCIVSYKLDKDKLKVSMMKQILDLQAKLLSKEK